MKDIVQRFLKYVSFDTQSSENNPGQCPSTEKQFRLAEYLLEELKAIGMQDVEMDSHGYVFAAANHLDGFLRWAYNSWNRNPFETTDFVHWPSGDCFLVYPGNRSSVRFERLRDGIESFEKINLLRSRAGASPKAAEIIADMDRQLLEIFSVERSKGSSHTQDVKQAQRIISETMHALSAQPALIAL